MKFFISFLAFSIFFSFSAHAQWSFSVNAGAAPGKTVKSSAVSLPNMYDGSDFALAPIKQSPTYAIGVAAKKSYTSGFFVRTEVMYNTSETEYLLNEIGGGIESNPESNFTVREHRLTLPISAGADIGDFSAHTGININGILKSDEHLDNLPGMDDDGQSLYLGWHAGLQYHIGPVGLEVRYMQDFRNYGPALTYGAKEVQFYGNRSRFMFLASFEF